MTDIIDSIILTFKNRIPTVTPEIARDVENEIRKQWGGEQAYIAKRCAMITSKKQTINCELSAGRTIAQIEQIHGIPRRTIYRLINHKNED